MGVDYTSVEEIERARRRALTDDELPLAMDAVSVATEWVEKATSRRFYGQQAVWTFDGNGKEALFIPDLLALGEVLIDDVTESDVSCYPLNQAPYAWLERYVRAVWPRGQANVVINGRWGYSEEPPAAIRRIATRIAMGIVWPTGGDNVAIGITGEKWGDYSIQYGTAAGGWQDLLEVSPSTAKALKPYRRLPMEAV